MATPISSAPPNIEQLANDLIASAHRKGPNKRYDEWMALEYENLKQLPREEVWKNVCIIWRDIAHLKNDPRFENSRCLQNAEKIRALIESYIPLQIRQIDQQTSLIAHATDYLSSASQNIIIKPLRKSAALALDRFDQMSPYAQGALGTTSAIAAFYFFYHSSHLTKLVTTLAATQILPQKHWLGQTVKALSPFIIIYQSHSFVSHLIDHHVESIPIAGISKDLIKQAQDSFVFCRRIVALGQFAALGRRDALQAELRFMAGQYAFFNAPHFVGWLKDKIWS